jgi:catechol 2,3-dioxygenase-like lactoylglutathione lyase family enzyme
MILGLFETHLFVADLERSMRFYSDLRGLELCYTDAARKAAFFWIGQPKAYMLGLWQKPETEIDKRHFAFRCSVDDVLHHSIPYLKERGLQPYNFLKDGQEKPMVFAWMPAVAIYFTDPDGHYLEFIAILDGPARPELGVIAYEEWLQLNDLSQ